MLCTLVARTDWDEQVRKAQSSHDNSANENIEHIDLNESLPLNPNADLSKRILLQKVPVFFLVFVILVLSVILKFTV